MGETSFIIHEWFITKLKLTNKDLLVFALIYSFTKDGKTRYYGSLNYLMKVLGCSRRTVINSLDSLVETGLIIKEIQKTQNEPNKYYINLEVVQKLHYQSSAKIAPEVVQKLHEGSAKIAPNNNIYNNIDKDSVYSIDILKEEYLKNDKVLKAVIKNKDNKIKDLADLKYKLNKFNEHCKEQSKLALTIVNYSTYFRNCCKKGMFKQDQVDKNNFNGNIYNDIYGTV